MPSLPAEFRCFQHINFIFARNLPLKIPFYMGTRVPKDCVKGEPLDDHGDAQIGCQGTSPELMREIQCVGKKPAASVNNAEDSGAEASSSKGTPSRLFQPDDLPSYDTHRCVSSYYVLRELTTEEIDSTGVISQFNGRVCYQSEVCVNTQHPIWQLIPTNVLLNYATHTRFILEIYYCCQDDDISIYTQTSKDCICYSDCVGEFSSSVASSCLHPNFERVRCVYRVLLDTTRLRYVANSIAEADQHVLDESNKNTLDSTVLLVKCFDGVFILSPEIDASPSMAPKGAEKAEAPWCRVDIDSGSLPSTSSPNRTFATHSDFYSCGRIPSSIPRGGMSVGDLKSLSIATLAWRNMHRIVLERRQELLDGIDSAEVSRRAQAAHYAMDATLKAYRSHFSEQLTMAMLGVEQLRSQVEERQRVLDRHERAFSLLKERDACLEEVQFQQITSDKREELQRTELRFKLAQSRRRYALELASLYPVKLGVQCANSSENTKRSSDTINGVSLPLFTQQNTDSLSSSSNLFSQPSAQEMYNDSIALGYAAHVIQTLAVIYGSVLPFPLLVAGSRSRVLLRPNLSPELAAASCTGSGDAKLPLFCQSAVSRPLMQAAVTLLAYDILTLAQAMGKDVAKVCSFGLRLGAALQYILSDKSN
ncbi:unnamed protein product [Phytomonas sp. EM1]|nr:unnamed protein product [Phytomonas sp. EM1]|eukprot:CCW63620.1 unnamed protein product [Phytomonas sp. isolate EM1]